MLKKETNNLLKEDERIKLVLSASDAGIWDWNIKTREAVFDERWAEITGHTLAELEPTNIETWNKLVHPDDLSKLDILLEKHYSHQSEHYEYETRMKHKNGEWVFVQIRGKVIEWDDAKKPVRMVGIIIDITDKKRAEHSLLESEIRFRTTFDYAIDPIFIAEIREGDVPRINDINLAVTSKLGYTKDELINKPMAILHPDEKRGNILQRVKKIIAGEQLHFESLHVCKNGSILPVEMSAKKILINNKSYIYIIERDISERKMWEKEILETQKKLEKEIANKDKFFSIISHDLKAPFSALLGTLQLLDESYIEMNDEEKKEIISVARRSSKNIFNLLEGILDWSRANRDTMNFSPSIIDLKILLNNVIQVLFQSTENKNINIINKISPSSILFADQKMLETIFRNLIINGIKFTQRGGEIVIASKRKGNMVEISVSDNGIGITENDISKLFRIDVHHTTVGTESETGTGVGLILCKELVEKHGGKIWVESKFGKGSKFILTLPLEESSN